MSAAEQLVSPRETPQQQRRAARRASTPKLEYPSIAISRVERALLARTQYALQYESENMPLVQVDNVMEMGRVGALMFLEWAAEHPRGVVSLPTGRTPELVIKFLRFYRERWADDVVQSDLRQYGLDELLPAFPDLSQLRFVQMDEFYPIEPGHERSFAEYVKTFYKPLLGTSDENMLTIDVCSRGVLGALGVSTVFPGGLVDLSLLQRDPISDLERIQARALREAEVFCAEYEEKIAAWGGIDFFLGGIGYDGHIAFNMPGTPFDRRTHLCQFTYETTAQSASDLGGLVSKTQRAAVTIGLGTILAKRDAMHIIIAAGEGKASMVAAAALTGPTPNVPVSAIQLSRNGRILLTDGAAKELVARKAVIVAECCARADLMAPPVIDCLARVALCARKRLVDLTDDDLAADPAGRFLLGALAGSDAARESSDAADADSTAAAAAAARKAPTLREYAARIADILIHKVELGTELPRFKRVLHTAPHHDDIMLSYFPLVRRMALQHNSQDFVYVTSGFNAVTNRYVQQRLTLLLERAERYWADGVHRMSRDAIVEPFRVAFAEQNADAMLDVELRFFFRAFVEYMPCPALADVLAHARELLRYIEAHLPGSRDRGDVQLFKGALRETEVDRMWSLLKVSMRRVHHLRARFYTGDYFSPLPSIENDARPMLELYQALRPDVVTVAFDPQSTGPDTHYKVLQIVAQALRMSDAAFQPQVWGYRNVWFRFSIAETTHVVPVGALDMFQTHTVFINCFSTQKDAPFPAPAHNGPFSELSNRIQRDQMSQLRTLLGDAFFDEHPDPTVRMADGLIFMRHMHRDEFLRSCEDLRDHVELHSML